MPAVPSPLKIRTPLTDLLGLQLPIVQAPVGSATCPALAAAVSDAGGLGMLAVTWLDFAEIRHAIRETRARTKRPFGVNLVLTVPQHARLQVCLEEGAPIVSLSWGSPDPYLPMIREAGAILMHTVAGAEEARQVARAGAHVVVTQGWEAGGHVQGTVSTMALVPRVVDVVSPVPVVAAGGIGDGRGIAAVLALGAAAAWMGTRFLATEEALIHPLYKQAILKACEADTLHCTLFDIGWPNAPHRVLRNTTVKDWEAAGRPPSGHRPGDGKTIAAFPDGRSILRYSDVIPLQGMTGDVEALALYAGQSAGMISTVSRARDVVQALARQTRECLRRSGRLAD